MKHVLLAVGYAAAMIFVCLRTPAQAQQPDSASPAPQAQQASSAGSAAPAQQQTNPTVYIYGAREPARPAYKSDIADLGPLGDQNVLNTPSSVSVVPESLMTNLQVYTVNDTMRYLPSVEIRDQQGFEVSRPQSRGFIS
ncbi:MAG: TonB-dependent receptor plug domain-containing protein, partial [Acetobacteraceae bacterium]